jgi:Flp pilus assembly protein TadD
MIVGRLSHIAFLSGALLAVAVLANQPARAGQNAAAVKIDVDYPREGSIFPPDITAPTMLWRDSHPSAIQWRIEVSFADKTYRGKPLQFTSRGEPAPVGEIDPNCKKAGAVDPTPTAEQAQQHSWQPDNETWATIKRYSVQAPATITFLGFNEADPRQPVSHGAVRIQTSRDPVGAPIFFRDVPLISVPVGEKGVIMPLPTEAVPLIAWRLRYVNETKSRLMMEGLPTCANCHSFSRDGKTLGLDVDGPQNDKGLYGLIPIKKDTSIKNEYVIRWAKFSEEPSTRRFGFMSQVSPDGQYVITSIENPGTRVKDFYSRFYNGFYKDYGFGQVFFPTRGVLAWYSKATGKLQPLPGADELDFVQAGAFWSPDGKYLVFSRARARDSYTDGQKEAQYANDPNETQIQYDLYRIPFNDGKGGKAEPVLGASDNGFSNNFPKVSPDGKWIVFVKCRNGLLMRPDSQLFIVPFEGGTARPLNSNTSRMNSWHSFSPNGRWLVFSSKSRSLYTQMYLTHIDENGNDSPAILIEHATAANRAVNIPEFANIQPGTFETLDAPATDFYRQVDRASALSRKGNLPEALTEWQKAVQLDPEDPKAHFNLAISLEQTGKTTEAIDEYRKSIDLNPQNDSAYTNLGVAMAGLGKMDDAMALFVRAININDRNAKAEANFGAALLERGRLAEAEQHCRRALEIDPASAEAHNALGWVLARGGKLDEGIDHLKQAVKTTPDSTEFQYNLGRLLAAKRSFAEAIPHLEKAVLLSKGLEVYSVDLLASMYSEVGRYSDAVLFEKRAVELSVRNPDPSLQKSLQEKLQRFEGLAAQKP